MRPLLVGAARKDRRHISIDQLGPLLYQGIPLIYGNYKEYYHGLLTISMVEIPASLKKKKKKSDLLLLLKQVRKGMPNWQTTYMIIITLEFDYALWRFGTLCL